MLESVDLVFLAGGVILSDSVVLVSVPFLVSVLVSGYPRLTVVYILI